MVTQMSYAKRGIATEEMKQVAKDEQVDIDLIVRGVAKGVIIIPKNNARRQEIKVKGIGKDLSTKVNVNIGTSTLRVDLKEEVEKAKVAVRYGADTIMDLSDAGNLVEIRRTLLDVARIPFGYVPVYQAYANAVSKYKNPLEMSSKATKGG
jgi:phosphomethylpyrimidine synthase